MSAGTTTALAFGSPSSSSSASVAPGSGPRMSSMLWSGVSSPGVSSPGVSLPGVSLTSSPSLGGRSSLTSDPFVSQSHSVGRRAYAGWGRFTWNAPDGIRKRSDVEELHVAGVLLDERPTRLDVLTHEHGEDLVGLGGVVERDLQQRAAVLVHRRLAELLVVHLAEALVALDRVVLRQAPALALAELAQAVALAVAVGELVVGVAPAQAEERRLREVDVAGLDERAHEAEEQRQQQRADVHAVDVGVGHQHDLVIAGLLDVEVLADAGAEGGDERLDLVVGEDLVDARLLDVEDLAADREDRLGVRVAGLRGRAAGAVALDDEHLGDARVLALAVLELARQAARLEQALAAGRLAGLARRHARGRGLDRLADDVLALVGVGTQPVPELLGHGALDEALDLGVAELGLGLTLELRLGELDRDDGGETLAHVVAGEVLVLVLEQVLAAREVVDELGHRRAEALLVRAALVGVDRVGVGVHRLAVRVRPLHRELEAEGALGVLHLDGDHLGVHGLAALAAVEVVDVVDEAVVVAVG